MHITVRRTLWVVFAALAIIAPSIAAAEVTRVEILSRADVLDGKAFGSVGAYEKLAGKIYFSLDPNAPSNRNVTDLDKAPRNAAGRVEFSSDIFILRPKDPQRGNGVVFLDVINRGNLQLLSRFNLAQGGPDPQTEAQFGDGFLMRQGFTIVAVGWELSPNGSIALHPPIATDNGKPITGWVRNWFVPDERGTTFDLHTSYWTGFRAYPPLDYDNPRYSLSERKGFFGQPRVLPRSTWKFGHLVAGRFVPDGRYVFVDAGLKPGYTYEISYETKDPRVAGTGFAALRDAASYFKNHADAVVRAQHVYAFGASQTGRALRAFVHKGFTTDEQGRRAVDAVWMDVAGASLGTFTERFAQPNEGGFYTTSWFPFLYETTRDPVTGKSDGLGAQIPAGLHPKIISVESSSEYWDRGRVTALNHVSLDGTRDVPLPDNMRMYLIATMPHGGGSFPPAAGRGQLKGSMIDGKFAERALLIGLDRWVRMGEPPPPSRHPRLSDGTLAQQETIRFPEIRGVQWPYKVPGGYRGDVADAPGKQPLPFLVPQVDRDGNEIGGIRLPDVAVPLATHTGWAFRNAEIGAPDEMLFMAGSYVPFARTRAERERNGDPRASIAERYPSRADYLQRVEDAARKLVQERYLLVEDVPAIIDRATRHWALLGANGEQ